MAVGVDVSVNGCQSLCISPLTDRCPGYMPPPSFSWDQRQPAFSPGGRRIQLMDGLPDYFLCRGRGARGGHIQANLLFLVPPERTLRTVAT